MLHPDLGITNDKPSDDLVKNKTGQILTNWDSDSDGEFAQQFLPEGIVLSEPMKVIENGWEMLATALKFRLEALLTQTLREKSLRRHLKSIL